MATLAIPLPLKTGAGWELLQESESTFDFHVYGPDRCVLHCVPNVFGKPFISLPIGHNSFTFPTTTVTTQCCVWSEETWLRFFPGGRESRSQTWTSEKSCAQSQIQNPFRSRPGNWHDFQRRHGKHTSSSCNTSRPPSMAACSVSQHSSVNWPTFAVDKGGAHVACFAILSFSLPD